jgi:hypothetical protein
VYGSIVIGNIPNGIYTGDIILNLDYDWSEVIFHAKIKEL